MRGRKCDDPGQTDAKYRSARSGSSSAVPIRVGGWAVDLAANTGTGVSRIDVLDGGCDGELIGQAEYGIVRDDVAERYGHEFRESGWELVLDRLTEGVHTIGVLLATLPL